jgi:hypothetical protein
MNLLDIHLTQKTGKESKALRNYGLDGNRTRGIHVFLLRCERGTLPLSYEPRTLNDAGL